MQGFNRYIPPDYDPKQHSTLNSHQGKKHALGKRAKDIDKGVLIVRFELPFNIWCGTCGAHIGAGVRYNAQKRKVGNYYSTPIFAFRCKCHLCSGWFEIRTDPKNSRYVVEEGAKQKNEDWDPEENGGFAVHDTEAPSASEPPADPFDHLEKTINQQTWAKQKASHLTDLLDASKRLSADPYMVSSALRRRFREEKKVILEKQGRDDGLREKYGLHEEVDLGDEDVEKSRAMWEARREARGLPVGEGNEVDQDSASGWDDSVLSVAGSSTAGTPRAMPGSLRKGKGSETDGSPSLAQVLRKSTAKRYDPFADAADALLAGCLSQASTPSRLKLKTKDPFRVGSAPTPTITKDTVEPAAPVTSGFSSVEMGKPALSAGNTKPPTPGIASLAGGLLAGYGSD